MLCLISQWFQFFLLGNAQQVQFLGLLVFAAVRVGTQQFVKNIFSSSAGRLVFDAYKNNVRILRELSLSGVKGLNFFI